MKTANISAIILAAGMSSRMGELKPLMPLGETRVIEHIVRLFHSAGVEDICVVAG
ncbi:MAG: NTP transferase domain-containing protein, partial [Deltaproteobacteria bacterium]|nr:NTP transferase domain-containing protein [Deltaproteobacteria bacterium]